jgi:hypothetical protein
MAADKNKQNLRYKIVSQKINKRVRYDGFTPEEIKLIKAQKNFNRFDKELNNFWGSAKRNENGSVDWNSMSDEQLDLFEFIDKQKLKYQKQISKAEDKGLKVDKVMDLFMKLNTQSASY